MGDVMKDQNQQLPSVSFIIPTFQVASTLAACLNSVFSQDYPSDRVEVIVVDGGSFDTTVQIASDYDARIVPNPHRVEDGPNGGKAIGARYAAGEVLCFLDSDNVIQPSTWLRNMIRPLSEDPNVVVSSRLLRREDPAINRFCSFYAAMTPSGDLFIPFDRPFNRRIGKVHECYYTYVTASSPPCLANGSVIRKTVLEEVGGFDYDTEVMSRLTRKGLTLFAQSTSGGILHLYVPSLRAFLSKAIRRSKRFITTTDRSPVSSLFFEHGGIGHMFFVVLSALLPLKRVPVAISKVRETHDAAWLYYPITGFLATLVYLIVLLTSGRKGLAKIANVERLG